MRFRRTLAPAILTFTALGSIITVPAVALTTATAPAFTAAASGAPSPDAVIMHG